MPPLLGRAARPRDRSQLAACMVHGCMLLSAAAAAGPRTAGAQVEKRVGEGHQLSSGSRAEGPL
jgi:hypothetical protein